MHGREKQEVERYFLRLKILLRNISPYIYIYLCRSQSSRVCKTKNKRLKRGGQKWRDEEEKWKQSRRVFPPLFVYARNTRARMCVFRATISVHKKRFEAGAYKFKWLVAKAGWWIFIGLAYPHRAVHLSSVRGDTRGDKSTVALSLVRSISPDSVSKRKAFGGVET